MLVGVLGSEIMHFSAQGGLPVVYARKGKALTHTPTREKDVERSAAVDAQSVEKEAPDSASDRYTTGPSLVWKNLTVNLGEKKLLNGISGYVRPGDLIALCGASGAGKTTLLTHLSLTNGAGNLTGDVEFGNKPLGKYFKKISGTCLYSKNCSRANIGS
jgi:ABC-type transport system involved in cytochrome bd biosynthesis fused ATPase/permease subunit